jgi:putative copper export protein
MPVALSQVALRYLEFLGYFAIYGALGFGLLVLRSRSVVSGSAHQGAVDAAYQTAHLTAARIGLIGALVLIIELIAAAAQTTSTAHPGALNVTFHPGPKILIQFAFALLAAIGFGVAGRASRAWVLAAIAGFGFVLRNSASRKWSGPVNPLHEAGAALWLGTLFVLVAAGLPTMLRAQLSREQRGKLIAGLFARFSPLAIAGATLMGLTGIITSWTHLKYVAALWTTAYGLTLLAKLVVVAIVLGLGAWNWHRIAPKLEAENVEGMLRRLSTTELSFAAVVLLLTAVLVLLPSPKLPAG